MNLTHLDTFVHHRYKMQPDTDPRLIKEFKRNHKMIRCPVWSCRMTLEACKKKHEEALRARKYVFTSGQRFLSNGQLGNSECKKCRKGN